MNLKNNLKGLIDIAFITISISGSIYAYNEYKNSTEKIYVVDAQKIYQIKQTTLKIASATEDDVAKYYDSLEKMIVFSTNYINSVSEREDTLVYPKASILTTKSKKVVDLTDELINRLKQQNLLP